MALTQEQAKEALKTAIASGRALIVCGAGVSSAATAMKAPGWLVLIKRALDAAIAHTKSKQDADWVKECSAKLAADNVDDWLQAADVIEEKLGGPDGAAYNDFFRHAVGGLQTTDTALLDSIRLLRTAVATTNYDDCLRNHFSAAPATWRKPRFVAEVLKNKDKGIWHVHGHWQDPESLVFSASGYERVRKSKLAQFLQQHAAFDRNLVFIGCSSDGLGDSNVGKLLEWFGGSFGNLGGQHFVLTLDSDLGKSWPDAVMPVGFGGKHDLLPGFVRSLAPVSASGELPPDPQMIGREDRLAEVVKEITDARHHVIIPGGPGIGKSTLALAAAHAPEIRAAFAQRHFIALDDMREGRGILVALAQVLAVRAEGLEAEILKGIESALAAHNALVIFDNAESPFSADANGTRTVFKRLAALTGLRMIVTIRGDTFVIPGAALLDNVVCLSKAESETLFLREAANDALRNDACFPELIAQMDGHPLSIMLLAPLAHGASDLSLLLQEWKAKTVTILLDGKGDHRLTSTRVSLALSIENPKLNNDARHLFSLLAHLPSGMGVNDLVPLAGVNGTASAMLLERFRLADRQDGRLRVLAPLREAALLDYPAEPRDQDKLIGFMLDLMEQCISAGTGAFQSVAERAMAEAGNFDGIIHLALDRGTLPSAMTPALVGLAALHKAHGLGGLTAVLRSADEAFKADDHDTARFLLIEIGDIKISRGDLRAALDAFVRGKNAAEASGDQRGLSVSLERIGDVKANQGDGAGALKAHEDSLAIAQRLAAQDPTNAVWQRDLSVSLNKIGDVKAAQGDGPGALKAFEDSFAIRQRLASQDGANAEWQHDLSVSLDRIGDVKAKQGDGAGALNAFEGSLAIRQGLVRQDPSNAGWQRDLSVSNERIGDIKMANGDLIGALEQYRASLDRMEPIRDRDTANAALQRFTSVTLNKIGDVKAAQGDGAGALRAHEDSLAIAKRLASQDQANAGWQRDLLVSHFKLSQTGGDARVHLTAALSIAEAMAAKGILAPVDGFIPGLLRDELAKLK